MTWPNAAEILPDDAESATLVGRAWVPDVSGPSVVVLRGADVVDVSAVFPTMRALTESADPARPRRAAAAASGTAIGTIEELVANTPPETRDAQRPWLLSPIDLHVVKAAGVTFPVSMLERVIEERARGDQDAAAAIRAEILATIGGSLDTLRPGSDEAMALKAMLIERGWWSQYLEVGIGPDAEVFTKAPVLATVGRVRRCRRAPRLAVEQPRARGRARRRLRRPHRRREPRQRRQPARRRGPQRPAARQGQGQQRVRLGRTVHPPVRRRRTTSTPCAPRSCDCRSPARTATGSTA